MYKEELREQVLQAMSEYFHVEQGNKLTIFSMNGLSMHLDKVFEQNFIQEEESK